MKCSTELPIPENNIYELTFHYAY